MAACFGAFLAVLSIPEAAFAQCDPTELSFGVPYHCENRNLYDDVAQSDALNITIGGVRPKGEYYYRYVEVGDQGALPQHVISGTETTPGTKRFIIRDVMDRWEQATDDVISWNRCTLGTCPIDDAGNPAEVVIGIDEWRAFFIVDEDTGLLKPTDKPAALGCSHAWYTEHFGEPNRLFRGRRMAFNSEAMIGYWNVAHEVGHCLGLIHPHQRPDRAHWLEFLTFEEDAMGQGRDGLSRSPVVGNFSYSSPVIYPDHAQEFRCGQSAKVRSPALAALAGQKCVLGDTRVPSGTPTFGTVGDANNIPQIPPEAASEVKQYHAKANAGMRTLDYFNTLSRKLPGIREPNGRANERPLNPSLSPDQSADPLGSPALVRLNGNEYVTLFRGANDKLFWRSFDPQSGWMPDWVSLQPDAYGLVDASPAAAHGRGGALVAIVQRNGAIRWATLGNSLSDGSAIRFEFAGGSRQNAMALNTAQPATGGQVQVTYRVARQTNGDHIGVAIAPGDQAQQFDIFAVRSPEITGAGAGSGNAGGEIVVNRKSRTAWGGWRPLPGVGAGHSVTARPAVAKTGQNRLSVLVTTNDGSAYCGLTELALDSTPGRPLALISSSFQDQIKLDCASPPAIAADRRDGQFHIFLVDYEGDLIYRHSTWLPRDHVEIGGLPKTGSGVAVAGKPSARRGPGLLIVMNGSDVMGQYAWDAARGAITATPLQAGGAWFRRWGSVQ